MSRSVLVRALLQERYPDHLIPAGYLAQLGHELGISRQHVRTIALRAGYIVVARPPELGGAAHLIRELLAERFPDRRLPHGSLQQIASELGVSRQHVRQVALAEGYHSQSRARRREAGLSEDGPSDQGLAMQGHD